MPVLDSIASPDCCSAPSAPTRLSLTAQIARYKALWILFIFAFGASLAIQYPYKDFSMALWMRHSMGFLWLVLACFKLLNLKGFVQSYAKYDLLTRRWTAWGYGYPFIELALGMAYLVPVLPKATYFLTILLLSLNSLGVMNTTRRGKKVHCACLGGLATWPIGKITLIENAFMMGMAIYLLYV